MACSLWFFPVFLRFAQVLDPDSSADNARFLIVMRARRYRENIGNVKFAYFSSRTSSATDQRVVRACVGVDDIASLFFNDRLLSALLIALLCAPRLLQMFVGTEAGVIAGLRVRHGDIAWRQVLPEGDTLDHLAFDPSARLLLSVSGACSVARLWNAADGTLQWDSASFIRAAPVLTHELEAKAALAGDVANEKENACSAVFVSAADRSAPSRVAVTLAGQVVLLDLATGAQLWSWSSKSQSQSLSAWQPVQVGFDFAADADHVTVLARNGDRSAVVALHVATGAVDRLIELPASVTSYMVRLSPVGLLAVLKADGVAVVRAGADLAKAPTQTLSSLGLKGSSESVELTFNAGQVLALRSKAASVPRTAVVLVSESASGAISVRQLGSAVDGDARVGVAQDGTGSPRSAQAGQVLVGVQQQQQFKLSVHLLRDPATAPQQLEWTVPDAPSDAPAAPAALSHVFAGVAQLAGGAEVTRVLVTRADHSVALAQDGKQFWRREEALASVVIAELVDPPSDSVFGSVEENTFPSFSQRLGPQLRSLVSLFRSTVGSVRRGAALTLRFVASKVKQLGIAQLDALPLASMAGEAESVLDRVAVGAASASASDDNQADFGFRKVLVLVTAAGKVFGLDSSTQQELWSRRLTALDDCPLQRCDWRLLSLRKAEVVLLITPKAGVGAARGPSMLPC